MAAISHQMCRHDCTPFRSRALNTCQSCELHTFTTRHHHSEWLSGRFLSEFSTIQELPGFPVVVSSDHTVCLIAEHSECQGSLRLHKLKGTNAEGADRSPVFFMIIL